MVDLIEPDGTRFRFGDPGADQHATVRVNSPRFYRALFGGTIGLGEAYRDGIWDCDDLVAKRRSKVPMILAGGLTAENVSGALDLVRPFAVDVVSGVEAEPGRKDQAKVEAFLEAVGVQVPSRAASQ